GAAQRPGRARAARAAGRQLAHPEPQPGAWTCTMNPRRSLVCLGVVLSLAICLGLDGGCGHTSAPPPAPAAAPPTKPDHEHAVETGLAVASTPQGLMREGAETAIQRRLQAKGFLH